ncbi:D-alanyl-D-alanine carboxypeptidase [Pelagibius litoralis]|uniref:serine-type D-Ala-D-Ala carboxypeptidase n=1 Tax=Pelagibius litoralis TaxID=374515 RepID=A0A967C241_9PROT|nr:D-alanyl-D-alanine carboxypeptidase family protein [Pelagibius litoralis]NIA67748.1 D-alanyl-D-alanine carboxypeptidase [Pelagibius litoralis]
MKCIRSLILVLASASALGFLALLSDTAEALETQAREAFLIDAGTGAVLLDKNSEVSMPPASMSKIMTAFMVFERLKDGSLSLDDKLPVSEKAWRMGGSKMFVEVGDQIRVEDLLRGVIVQSGNDACIVLAEALAGSEEAFAEQMTAKAREIGMTNSTFANATGWPDPNQRMTARDLATLAKRIITDHPEYYHYYSEKEFVWSDIRQGNRNPLLYKNIGSDGLKTGHTEEAGYGLTASAFQNGRRLVLVVNGLGSQKERSAESERLMSWGFREFGNYALFEAGETVDEAPVWLGAEKTVPLVVAEDLIVTLPRSVRNGMKVSVVYDSPIPAPVPSGLEIARLRVSWPEGVPIEVPLMAGQDVEQLGPFGRIGASIKFLLLGTP